MAKAVFFKSMRAQHLVLSYNDVRLKTNYSEVSPVEANTATRFSRKVKLKIPIASAPMDTVTESKMAIEIAKLGGIGIIHRNMTAQEQAKMVARTKLHMNGRTDRPICVSPMYTMGEVVKMRCEKGYKFHTFPVTEGDDRLVGLLTRRHFKFCKSELKLVSDVMERQIDVGDDNITMGKAYELMTRRMQGVLPLVDKSYRLKGMYVFSDIEDILSGDESINNRDKNGQLVVGAAVGTGKDTMERVELLVSKSVDVIVIDTAHGDSKPVYDILCDIKSNYSDVDVVVGNVSQPKSAKNLVDAGADGVKVGQGPGSICTTRIVAGVGRPQVTAIYECCEAVRGSSVPICADGGIRNSGDITIAIGAGAHSVMLGNLLAGTDPTPGEVIIMTNGQRVKAYRGMGSMGAMKESAASRERYGQDRDDVNKLVPEGIEAAVPCRGSLEDVILQYIGGLRSGMGYIGAATIEELRQKGDFDRITSSGLEESHPHNVVITREAPNYQIRSR